jgi:hypothetical protein
VSCPICKCETHMTVCPQCGGNVNHANLRIAQGLSPVPPRYDEALLRDCLSAMPLGKYHRLDTDPQAVYRDGMPVIVVHGPLAANGGLVAALVHLLNAREQTEIPR